VGGTRRGYLGQTTLTLFARKQINNKQGLIAQAKLNVWQYLNYSGVVMK
jgi:hypothetical protein